MSSQFQPYLQSIATTYEKWSELYTLTDAQGREKIRAKQSAPFDFGLIVQTVKREEREQRNEEKVERFPVLEGIRKYADQHVLLVGRPGSGKSTALARLMLEEAEAALTPSPSPKLGRGEEDWRIPVLVELRYWQSSIEQLILNSLTRHGLAADQFEAVLSRSLLLFDGVNELPSEEARSQLSAFRCNHPKLPMIFTTRDLSLGGDLGIEKQLEMQPLEPEQMKAFIRAYVPEQAEQLKDRLREFGQTPLLLWMLCEVIKQMPDNRLPSNLAEVFQAFTIAYEISSVRKHEVAVLKGDVRPLSDRRLWKKALKSLALLMMQGETPVDFRVVIHRDEAERELSRIFPNERFPVRDILDDLLKYHLLQNRSVDQIEFRHQLIQEYYAAEGLLERLPKLSDEVLKREYLNYLKWTEPIALMLALVDEVQGARVVKLALEVDLRLGARLAGEVKPEIQKQTTELVAELEVPDWLRFRLFRQVQSDFAEIHRLLSLRDYIRSVPRSERDVLKDGLDAIGETETPDPDLLQYIMEHPDSYVRARAAEALGRTRNKAAVSSLLQLAKDPDSSVRLSTVDALREIGGEAAVSGLLQLVKDPDSSVRLSTVDALREIGGEAAVSGLLQLVEYFSFFMCQQVASALGEIGSEATISSLLQLVKYPDYSVRTRVTEALGKTKSEAAVSGLLQLVKDPDSVVRWSVVEALREIESEAAVSGLLQLAEDSSSSVRKQVAYALGETGSEAAVSSLLQLVKDSDNSVCASAAGELEQIAKKHVDTIAQHLPYLLTLISTNSGEDVYRVILAIQENCKYYNYEIYQAYLKAQKDDRQTSQTSEQSAINYYIDQLGNLNTGTVNIAGDQIGVESSTPDLN